MHRLLLVALTFGMSWGCAFGQASTDPKAYGIKSKKAAKLYSEAKTAQRFHEYGRAILGFQAALKIEPEFDEALYGIMEIQYGQRALQEARTTLEAALEMNPKPTGTPLFYAGQIYLEFGQYEKAAGFYRRFLAEQNQLMQVRQEAEHNLAVAEFAERAVREPIQFAPQNLGSAINTADQEYMPLLTADGQTLLFTGRRPDGLGGKDPLYNMYEEDFFRSTRTADGWTVAQNIGPPLNTELSEGAATLSPDGSILIFTACDRPEVVGGRSCDLFFSEYDGQRWLEPRSLGKKVNSAFWESYPALSNNGRTLYFASTRPGGKGGADIWLTNLVEDEYGQKFWTTPVNVGEPLNTKGEELGPFFHADDKTLYFASSGHIGFGKLDFFKATWDTAQKNWTQITNLGYPLNSPADERTLIVSTDGRTGYFNSDRLADSYGGIDIYQFELDPRIRPEPATWVRGAVLDSLSLAPIGNAEVEFVDVATGRPIRNATSRPTDGQFLVNLPLGRSYAAFVDKPPYLFYSQHFNLADTTAFPEGGQVYDLEILLQKLTPGAIVRLDNVFFDFDQATLKPESEIELHKVRQLLVQKPAMRIELRGHTDQRGDDAYNLTLSQERAEAVRTWLVAQGIAPERLDATGYGESLPVNPAETEAAYAKNRRTEFKVLVE